MSIKITLNKIWRKVSYKMLRKLPLHPFALAIFPILSLFANNIEEVSPVLIFAPLFSVLFLSIAFYFITYLIFNNLQKSALLSSLVLILFFSYGHFRSILKDFNINLYKIKIGADKITFVLWIILFILGNLLILKIKNKLASLTCFLNIVSLLLIIFVFVKIVPFEIKEKRLIKRLKPSVITYNQTSSKIYNLDYLPDIYYLIFDRYAGSQTLKEEFGYDNSKFLQELENKGFYIAEKSIANYPKTAHSLASSLNFSYLDSLTDKVNSNIKNQAPLQNLLVDYKVWRFLKARGYFFIHLGSWWQPTRKNKYADINYNLSLLDLDEFSTQLFETTLAYPIFIKLKSVDYKDENSRRIEQKQRVPYKLKQLSQLPNTTKPKFVFAHMLIPHGPYVFDENGNKLSEKDIAKKSSKVNYLNQLKFTNSQILKLIEALTTNSKKQPIIIIQSDEGPCDIIEELSLSAGWGKCGEGVDWTKLTDKSLQVKMRILNAYLLPNFDNKLLYPTISPVNTFRIIFNFYFGTEYKLLPDKYFIFPDLNHPYKFIDVTEKVAY